MGVTFKLSGTGTRYKPRSPVHDEFSVDSGVNNAGAESVGSKRKKIEADSAEVGSELIAYSVSSTSSGGNLVPTELDASFSVNLLPNGFSLGVPTEKGKPPPLLQDLPKSLHPYDKSSETLFSALESGWLPGDILDDIPCKYLDGVIMCEVRDYRKCVPGPANAVTSGEGVAVHNVHLKMSTENVVKDIPSITDHSWTYSDLMEVEARILKAMQPELCLDPSPKLDRLCTAPALKKLKLGIHRGAEKRQRSGAPAVKVTSSNLSHGKKVLIDRVLETSTCQPGPTMGDGTFPYAHDATIPLPAASNNTGTMRPKSMAPTVSQPRYQSTVNRPRSMVDQQPSTPGPTSLVTTPGQDLTNPYIDPRTFNTSMIGKRDNPQMIPQSDVKRTKLEQMHLNQQYGGTQSENLMGSDMQWKNAMLQQHLEAIGNPSGNIGLQKYPDGSSHAAILEGVSKQDVPVVSSYMEQKAISYGVKEEPSEPEKLEIQEGEKHRDDPQNILEGESDQVGIQRLHSFSRTPYFPHNQGQWHNLDSKKDDGFQKKKTVNSPRVSGAPVHSPVSSKSGEISSGSMGAFYGTGPTNAMVGVQREKTNVSISGQMMGSASVNSAHNDAMMRQNHASASGIAKRSPSLPKNSAMSGVASPASVGNSNTAPLSANSPSTGTPPMANPGTKDSVILERFSKAILLTQRTKLNRKINKIEEYPERKPTTYSLQLLSICLTNAMSIDDLKDANDSNSMAKSLLGGSVNLPKTRSMNFVRTSQFYPENGVQPSIHRVRSRLAMVEKAKDGVVEALVQYGDEDDSEFTASSRDLFPLLPNTNYADLLANQYSTLMLRDGYQLMDDQIQLAPRGGGPSTAAQQPSTSASSDQMIGHLPPSNSPLPSPQPSHQTNLLGPRMPPHGNIQAVNLSPGYLPSPRAPPQFMDPTSNLQQQQQQQPRSSPLVTSNQLAQLNATASNHAMGTPTHIMGMGMGMNMGSMGMGTNPSSPSPMHMHLLQHRQQQSQQQQQQQPQQQRKMMTSLGSAMTIPNMMNMNMNMNMGGMTMGGMSGPMMGMQQHNSISSMVKSGMLTTAQAASMANKLRMAHVARVRPTGGGPQMPGLPAMLGQPMGRTPMGTVQRAALASMGPPKMPGTASFYMNHQHQQQQPQMGSPMQTQHQVGAHQMGQMTSQQVGQAALQQMGTLGSQQVGSQQVGQMGSQPMGQVGLQQMGQMGSPQAGPVGSQQMGQMGSPQMGQMGSQQMGQMGSPQVSQMGSPQVGQMGSQQMAQAGSQQMGQVGPQQLCQMAPVGSQQMGPLGAQQMGPLGSHQMGHVGSQQMSQLSSQQIGHLGSSQLGQVGPQQICQVGLQQMAQVGSPSGLVMSQQQAQMSPQQAQMSSPQQQVSSSGGTQQMGSQHVGPASPQLSSQTLGSIGSISSSPMEMQGVSKGNSVNNAG
ncbi:mediator of RNA polymerase II transcription subunit 15a isoform X2 [Amborella trichopoda]|uniref:mediator of RNA polymerase II transcription subunit 15a isoform X2 n=1 Tax=Amborella trichopoda TaxID=13333 RepID=UPI0005D404C9|nr:mediator of RNA polymerase II transcription subunit 15a isoform X2 [Amborella trichopoda]|eukprot:XP_011623128.1 mediator of RNA polymerase II transcription subunit 15a isoform X2 [Amborella trichopoda]